MLGLSHETVVLIARLVGLACMIALFIGVLVYIFWPGNRRRFRRAKRSVLEDEDSRLENDEPR